MKKEYPKVLTIAGSDSGGGAGIQADIKTISANGCYSMTAITAITSQNTLGVQGIFPIPIPHIVSQITSVLDDIGVQAVKIGMLHSSEVIEAVANTLDPYHLENLVIDPVMVATSGDRLLQKEAIESLKKLLIPKASLVTPNIYEAEILLGKDIRTIDEMKLAAEQIAIETGTSVLLKGGHLKTEKAIDYLSDFRTKTSHYFESERIDTNNTHGTGCTLSSAIAAHLALGKSMNEAISEAKSYLTNAIKAGSTFTTGKGNGPVHHFSAWY